jgi:hypothetical protein
VTESRPPEPDYSDPLHGLRELPRRPVVASAPVSGGLTVPDGPVPFRDYPGRTYGRSPQDAYPEQPAADAPWPAVAGAPPRPRRRVLGIALVAGALVIFGGIAAIIALVGPGGPRGTATPDQAVEGFLTAIYVSHDASAAGRHVCARARDNAELEQIVFQVRQNEQTYTAAQTSWTYPPIRPSGRQASAEVTLTMTTLNEQVSSRAVTLLLVEDRGWWVCDVRMVAAP